MYKSFRSIFVLYFISFLHTLLRFQNVKLPNNNDHEKVISFYFQAEYYFFIKIIQK